MNGSLLSATRRLAVLAVGLVLVLTGVAIAASPVAGSYRAKGQAGFSFTLTRGTCYLAPRNLTNFRARRGKAGRGLCFSSSSEPKVNPDCGADGHAISGETAVLSLFDSLRLSRNSLHVKAYSYSSGSKPIGYTELALFRHGRAFRGYIRVTDIDGLGNPCDTGELKFTAARH
jgi:hypothetical protein